ncbi:MAG TPA: hypothetical protein VG247_27865 [Pseudonocardiaceae bacterium]|nr:hypothetical protein [Pseudonocardiaceae bacterium]
MSATWIREPVRTALRVALADLHNLAGWTCFDSGRPGVAHTHFRAALDLAREAGHDALVATSTIGSGGSTCTTARSPTRLLSSGWARTPHANAAVCTRSR